MGSWACGGSSSSGDSGGSSDAGQPLAYCDVSPIFDAKCRRCHTSPPENGAPFSLEGYEAVSSRADLIEHVIQIDYMPYRGGPPLEPPVQDLTKDEEARIVEWVENGAPRGDGQCD